MAQTQCLKKAQEYIKNLLEVHEQQKINSQKKFATSSTTKTHLVAQKCYSIET